VGVCVGLFSGVFFLWGGGGGWVDMVSCPAPAYGM